MPTRADVIVIGGGQAGLATSRELGLAGIDHLVLERDRIGASWAGLWDNFRLNTPNWSVRLPGLPYGGPEPDAFASRAEMVAHLERYRAEMDAPVLEGVEVQALEPRGEGFELSTSDGPMSARSVVVCTGAYQRALSPPGTDGLPAHVMMLDTRAYRNPAMVPDGDVLVVGSGQSGCQIAEDLVDAGRSVILSCGRAPWVPRRIGDHDVFWWALETGFMSGTVETLPSPEARLVAQLTASGVNGGHDLHPRALQAKGVTLVGRFAGAEDGRLRFVDNLADSIAWGDARYRDFSQLVERLSTERSLEVPDLPDPAPFVEDASSASDARSIGTIIFSGGFRPDYSWVHVAGGFDPLGFPAQVDGASTAVPGLFFVGVHFLRTRKSSLLCGVGEDAAIVAVAVTRHLATDEAGAPGPNGPGPTT
jgi:putative flavoprotein involved in K+ transport